MEQSPAHGGLRAEDSEPGAKRKTDFFRFEISNLKSLHMHPIINRDQCTGCQNCVEICPSEVYEIEFEKSKPVRPEDCIECWACVNQCPTSSIQLHED